MSRQGASLALISRPGRGRFLLGASADLHWVTRRCEVTCQTRPVQRLPLARLFLLSLPPCSALVSLRRRTLKRRTQNGNTAPR